MIRMTHIALPAALMLLLTACGEGGNGIGSSQENIKNTKQYELRLSRFGDGSILDAQGTSRLDENETTTLTYSEGSTLTLKAIAKEGYHIHSWEGCDVVSDDLKECQTTLLNNQDVRANFTSDAVTISDRFIDLTPAKTLKVDADTIQAVWDDTATKALVQSVKVGMYITGDEDEGFLKKVTALSEHGNYTLFSVENAALEDVIVSGTAIATKKITHNDIDTSINTGPTMRNGVLYRTVKGFSAPEGVWLEKPADPNSEAFVVHFGDNPKTKGTTTVSGNGEVGGSVDFHGLKVTGSLKVKVTSSLSTHVSWFKLKELSFINKFDFEEALTLGKASEEPFTFSESQNIGNIQLQPISFMIGAVPVWITQKIELILGVDGTINAQLSASCVLAQHLEGGFIYKDGEGFAPHQARSATMDIEPPSFHGDASIQGYFKPQYGMKIYGIVGPDIYAKGYVQIDASTDLNKPLWCYAFDYRLSTGVNGGIKLSFESTLETLLGLIDENYADYLTWEIPLMEKTLLSGKQNDCAEGLPTF